MFCGLILAALLSVTTPITAVQPTSILHIKVVLLDAERKPTPVPNHALLISDNPATALPRRVVTKIDGSADVKLSPGHYTVESDQPVSFEGRAYQWTQMIEISAGRDLVLDLTVENAEGESGTSSTTASAKPLEGDRSFLLTQWQQSVVALWTALTHATGFVVDARGLIATNQRLIGPATSVEVQLTPAVKVAANVLVADAARDVAVLWVDPKVVGPLRPVPLECAAGVKPSVAAGQDIVTLGTPLREEVGVTSGTVSRVDAHSIVSDFILPSGSEGGPVFTTGGAVVGLTSVADENNEHGREDSRTVRTEDVCEVLVSAEAKMKDAAPPSGTHLSVEPLKPFPVDAIKDVASSQGSVSAYQVRSSDFDITFITPVLVYRARHQSRGRTGGVSDVEQASMQLLMDFGNWSEYVMDFPATLLVRVTPKLVESFWTKVARGAAQTQGISVPAIKRLKSGFARMQAFCGDIAVAPIHPFKIERRVADRDAVYEGLYAFDPGAIGPECGRVKLVLYSEKEPDKEDTVTVDQKVLQQIWQDFASYRAQK